jgi:uncharacterized protein (TIGR00369 family)
MSKGLSIEQIQDILNSSPMIRFFGVTVSAADAEKGTVTMTMPVRAELERLAGTGQYHGGAIAAFIDIVGDFALAVTLGGPVPTINLRVDYLRPASGGALRGAAATRRLGRTVGVVDIDVFDSQDRLVAVGRGTYGAQVG